MRDPNTDSYIKYIREGYAFFQNWAANTLLQNLTKYKDAKIIGMTMPMRTEPQVDDKFSFIMEYLFPLCMVLMYIMPIMRLVSRIVTEKES